MYINEVEDLARRTFNLLNGVINEIPIQYLEIVERSRYLYEQFLKPYDIIAGRVEIDSNGPTILVFAIDRVIEFLRDYDQYLHSSIVVHIIAHELSHSNQLIDYRRYANEEEYKEFIESCNNIYTYRFIENYREWLMNRLNLKELYSLEMFSDNYNKKALAIIRKEEAIYRQRNPIAWMI